MSADPSRAGIKLLHRTADPSTPLALCRDGEALTLVRSSNNSPSSDQSTTLATVSIVVDQDPYPGFTMSGQQMIWVKNYGENQGLLGELEEARFVQSVGRTIKQGFVTFPLCIILLSEKEIVQICAKCRRVETFDQVERFKRCGKCKRRYYCSNEHQSEDWPRHKLDCKDLVNLDFVSVENRRRRQELEMLGQGESKFEEV
ncbi:hypothetical protein JCM11491_000303 [Sporobolomyces phaffii]